MRYSWSTSCRIAEVGPLLWTPPSRKPPQGTWEGSRARGTPSCGKFTAFCCSLATMSTLQFCLHHAQWRPCTPGFRKIGFARLSKCLKLARSFFLRLRPSLSAFPSCLDVGKALQLACVGALVLKDHLRCRKLRCKCTFELGTACPTPIDWWCRCRSLSLPRLNSCWLASRPETSQLQRSSSLGPRGSYHHSLASRFSCCLWVCAFCS